MVCLLVAGPRGQLAVQLDPHQQSAVAAAAYHQHHHSLHHHHHHHSLHRSNSTGGGGAAEGAGGGIGSSGASSDGGGNGVSHHSMSYHSMFTPSRDPGTSWRCRSCGKEVTNRWHHYHSHTAQRSMCPYCPATYSRIDTLRSHLRAKHSERLIKH